MRRKQTTDNTLNDVASLVGIESLIVSEVGSTYQMTEPLPIPLLTLHRLTAFQVSKPVSVVSPPHKFHVLGQQDG